ncbi:MAG: glycosyltransferase family 4 protein [Paludibacter sp.]
MKILIVCSANSGKIMPFITEQGNKLVEFGCEVDYFTISSKGINGYLSHLGELKTKLKEKKYDIVHAHFGLSGALAVMQRRVPVVITFHNGETLTKLGNLISSTASLFSAYNIYVAEHIYQLTYFKKPRKSMILPCGINLDELELIPKAEAAKQMNLPKDKINILFGGVFANLRKNVKLANEAINLLANDNINLIEMKGYTRKEVNALFCGVDLMLLPTKSEGSPQVVKEAMACNCPIVATDVADIKVLLNGTEGCYLTTFEPVDVAEKIKLAIAFGKRTTGRDSVSNYDNKIIVKKITDVYAKIIKK